MHQWQPSYGPVRFPRGLVDVTVTDHELVLRHHDSWRDWVDSDWMRGGLVLLAILLAVGGALTSGVVRVVFFVLAAAVLGLVLLIALAEMLAMAWAVGYGLLMLLTRGGRARLKRGAADLLTTFGDVDRGWRLPRSQVLGVSSVEGVRRLTVRVATSRGELAFRSHDRGRLEGLARALRS